MLTFTNFLSDYHGQDRRSYLGHESGLSHIKQLPRCMLFTLSPRKKMLAKTTQPAYLVNAWPTPVFLLTKLTFMLLYLQIFRPMRWLRYGCYSGIVVMTLFYLSFWIVQLYCSTPANGQSWLQDFETPRYSVSESKFTIPLAALNLVFDLYIFVLPIAAVMRLQMSRQRKLATSAMFVSGFA